MITDSKKKCARSHPVTSKCPNCTFTPPASYKVNFKCTNNHRPYPEGSCQKCVPATCILMRQTWRHVDHVAFMNPVDVGKFVGYWERKAVLSKE